MLPPLPRCSRWAHSSLEIYPSVSAFPNSTFGSACTSTFSRIARRSLALRPAHSHGHQIRDRYPRASDISSPPCLPRLLPAGAVAGRGLHPLENAALSRRTWKAVLRRRSGDIIAPKAPGGAPAHGPRSDQSCRAQVRGGPRSRSRLLGALNVLSALNTRHLPPSSPRCLKNGAQFEDVQKTATHRDESTTICMIDPEKAASFFRDLLYNSSRDWVIYRPTQGASVKEGAFEGPFSSRWPISGEGNTSQRRTPEK